MKDLKNISNQHLLKFIKIIYDLNKYDDSCFTFKKFILSENRLNEINIDFTVKHPDLFNSRGFQRHFSVLFGRTFHIMISTYDVVPTYNLVMGTLYLMECGYEIKKSCG